MPVLPPHTIIPFRFSIAMPRFVSGFALSRTGCRLLGVAGLLAGCVGLAQAQTPSPLQEVRRLLRAEQPALAIQQAEQALQEQPQNAQLRFLQGVAQSQAGQNEAAQATFLALAQAYPELPEPYNNLAVLYAATGELDLARTALESALRIHPSYATALRNLGDVYARLAGRAWQQALAIDPTDATLRPKLEHWQHLPIVSLPLQNP